MEEVKVESDLRLFGVKKENVRQKIDKIYAQASDLLVFTLQWKDLEDYLSSAEAKIDKRFSEVKSKEMDLHNQTLALEERARVVAAKEAEFTHLDTLIQEKKKELDFLKNRVDSCAGEFKVEEMKLTQLRISVDECMVEQRSKTSQLDHLLESLSNTQLDLESKGQKLVLMEKDLESYRVQVSAEMEHLGKTQDCRTKLEEEIKKKSKGLTFVMDQIAKSEKLLKTLSSELGTTQGELESKGKLLQQMNSDLEGRRGEVSAEDERLRTTQDRRRVCEEEMMKKVEELTAVRDRIADRGKQLELLENQLDSQKKLLESRSSELEFKGKELEKLREAERSTSFDLDLREHLLKDTCQQLESKSKELEDIKGLIEERSAHYESIKMLIEEHAEELASKEKKQNEITEAIHKLSLEISSKEKTLERAEVFIEQLSEKQQSKQKELDSTKKRLERCITDYSSKTKELRSVKDNLGECLQNLEDKEDKLKSLQSLITERNKQVDEGEKKKHHLDNSNKELLRELQLKKEEVCSINNAIKKCSGELESKRRQYDQVKTSVTDLSAELKSKECDLLSVKKKFQDSLKDFRSKEERQARLEASLMEREQKLALKETQFDSRSEKIEQKKKDLDAQERRIDEKAQEVAKCVKDCERKAKELSSFLQQGNPDQPVNLLRDANVCDEKTLQLLLQGHLKKCPQLYQDVSSALKTSSDPAKLALDTIQKLYSAHQRMTISDPNPNPNGVRRSIVCLLDCLMDISPKPRKEVQGEAMKFAIEWKNTALVEAENPVEVLCFLHFLAAFSLAYTLDADKVHSLFDGIFLRKYAPSLCEALGVSALAPGTDEQQQSEAPNNNSLSPDVQEMTTVSQLANEDVLRDHDVSVSLSPNEVCTELSLFEDPGSFVLNSVKDALTGARQRGEMSLGEPIVKALLPFLEQLTRVVSCIDPDLRLDAAKVAQQWSKMMGTTSGQLLPLEALGFLQFIVAYGLVDRTRPNETLPFASYVKHFKQAPKLFHSLGLNNAIPSLVKQLLEARRYITAVRFMVYFNMNISCSPLLLLKEEINNLRRSVKENRTQAEDRDAGKLREIIEVIQDLKLEMDLPVDVIVKFMVPRRTLNQSQCVVPSSAPPIQPPQIFPPPLHMQASYISTHGNPQNEHVETYQAVGSTAFKGQSSHQTGIKRPRGDSRCPRSAIRPCFNPPGK